jgi:hypothetical protein
MAQEHDIVNRHKGEAIEILIAAKAPGGEEVIETPTDQTLIITVSDHPGTEAILSFDKAPQVILVDELTGEWFIQLTESNLAPLKERKTYYYNIWSQLGIATPRLQAKGKIVLDRSISV